MQEREESKCSSFLIISRPCGCARAGGLVETFGVCGLAQLSLYSRRGVRNECQASDVLCVRFYQGAASSEQSETVFFSCDLLELLIVNCLLLVLFVGHH